MANPVPDGVRLHVVSFSDSGTQASELLEKCWLLQPGFSAYGGCQFTALTDIHTKQHTEAIAQQSDMVFILGEENPASKTQSLQWIIHACEKQEVLCYAIIQMPKTNFADSNTANIWSRANNVLRIHATHTDASQMACDMMTEAVMGIATCLLGKSFVGVDFDDIKTMMQYGRNAEISTAEASGNQRAIQAAQDALRQLPDIKNARAIIGNIDIGDMDLAEYDIVSNAIDNAVDEKCVTMTCTAYNPSSNAFKLRITALY